MAQEGFVQPALSAAFRIAERALALADCGSASVELEMCDSGL